MIEMRWLEYETNIDPDTRESFVYPSKYKKLQCRRQMLDINTGYYWEEWKDVPTVNEGENNEPK